MVVEKINNDEGVLRRLRKAQETVCPRSQERFAQRAGYTGNGYRKIIHGGNKTTKIQTITLLCEANGINPEWVLTGNGEMLAKNDDEKNDSDTTSKIISAVNSLTQTEQKRLYNLILSVIGDEGRAELAQFIALTINGTSPENIESIKKKIWEIVYNK